MISLAFAQGAPRHYILILEDPPVASRFPSREAMATAEAGQYRQQIAAKQATLRQQLAAKHLTVIGSVSTVLNAMFVAATPDRAAELKTLPGVLGVVATRHFRQSLNEATQLVNAPAAWAALGGTGNAGAGIKIGILDSGIDQGNPAFQDPSLPAPAGFSPACDSARPSTCNQSAFTSNKVIVARSYVGSLVADEGFTDPSNSRPDDFTPRDHEGHGSAVASCAAGVAGTATPATSAGGSGYVSIGGVAPKAYLGNYRIYGSPEVNDTTTDDIIIMALDDAVSDGMDVVSMSSGAPATSGPLDTGAVCGNAAGVPCDPVAWAFEMAAEAGTVLTVSAGNDSYPGTIESPADAPSVIAVAASTNSHYFTPTVSVVAAGAPSNLQNLAAGPSDSANVGPITAPLLDVTALGDSATGCSPLPPFSLAGRLVLMEYSPSGCSFATKMILAQAADALGVILYMSDSTPLVSSTTGPFVVPTDGYGYIPAVILDQTDGQNLKNYIDANPGQPVAINLNGSEQVDSADQNQLASFSSMGPNLGPVQVKPELTAPGEEPNAFAAFGFEYSPYYGGILMASEGYDVLGELFSSSGFVAADGTSFSTPITAGAAALVLQAHPGVTGAARLALVRSALVNNTSQTIVTDDQDAGNPVNTFEIGSGLLNVGAAVGSNITVSPATISFGALSSGLPAAQQFTITNNGASAVTLAIAVSQNLAWDDNPSSMRLTPSTSSVSLAAHASQTVTITPSGTVPGLSSNATAIGSGPDFYSGAVTIQGSGVSLIVPYLYVVGDGIYAECPTLLPSGDGFDGTVGQDIPQGEPSFELIDDFGLPIPNVPVQWDGGSTTGVFPTIVSAENTTNQYGQVWINQVLLGAQPGTYYFMATTPLVNYCTGSYVSYTFSGNARVSPAINASQGVQNAASGDSTVAPGSYIAIYGSGLSDPDNIDVPMDGSRLPLAIDYVNVSFDVPSAGISVPGHLLYVSPTQVNLQVPWELQQALAAGQNSAFMKVTIDYSPGEVVTVPIQAFSPGFFGAPGTVAALDTNYHLINQSNPAVRGQYVQMFVNGLGPVYNQPASGDLAPASGNPLCTTTNTVTVTIGGQTVTASFAGLAPGFAGLYQVNFQVPLGLSPGNQPITMTVGGVTSQASAMWVQ
jgi:uncharacterized protein (TIGR03437 family)